MKTNKNTRIVAAEETLQIQKQGFYIKGNQTINISEEIGSSVKNTLIFQPEAFSSVLEKADKKIQELDFNTQITVKNCTVLEAAVKMADKEVV